MSEIKVLTLGQPDYPRNLANPTYPQQPFRLENPVVNRTELGVPKELYLLGMFLNDPGAFHLAIVGSRQLETQLHQFTFQYIQDFLPLFFALFNANFDESLSVVSGMSLGADAWAQRLAIREKIATLGIGASSINHPHHQSDEKVYARLTQTPHHHTEPARGVISEYPPSDKPIKEHYYDRNRIVAWMSDSLLAYGIDRPTSGAMHTISLARAMGIRVFYIESTVSPAVRTKLNQLGCIPVASAEDFIAKIKNPAL